VLPLGVVTDGAEPREDWLVASSRGAGVPTLTIVASAIAGAVACTLAVTSASDFPCVVKKAPIVYAWVTLLATQGAISWAGFAPALWIGCKAWRSVAGKTRLLLLAAFLCIVVLVATYVILEPRAAKLPFDHWPLGAQQSSRIGIISALIVIPALAALGAMWLTAARACQGPSSVAPEETALPHAPARDAASYAKSRDAIQSLLWFLGTLLSIAVVSTGVLRQTVIDGRYATPVQYPAPLVLSYGTFFTVVIVIGYAPVFLSMQLAGQRLVDSLLRDLSDVRAWGDERNRLGKLLGLDISIDHSLKSAVAILSPLIAGFVSLGLPHAS
jgi:hypothetical protein